VFRIDGCAIGVFCFIRFVVLWSLSVCDIRKEFLIGLRNAFSFCTCSGTWTCMKMVAKNLGILLFQLCLGAFFFFFALQRILFAVPFTRYHQWIW